MTDEPRFKRTPSPQTASWFLDLNASGQLDLDPPYQRRSVWNSEFRRFFVDSVIRNYPTQAIFLDVRVDPDGPTVYRVLDGKQRLTSLIGFAAGEFETPTSLEDLGLAELYYGDLPRDVRAQILGYLFTVETVSDASPAELNQAFDRLNRNVARLNKQELRHAQYGGTFITKMERYAEDELWEEIGLVTAARKRRMLDVEYVSEFYIASLLGVQDGKAYLDERYSEFDEEIPGERQGDRRFRRTRDYISLLHLEMPLAGTRFRNVADFYSLWVAASRAIDDGDAPSPTDTAQRLEEFADEIAEQETDRVQKYLLAARQGSNKGANRELRADMLHQVITGG